MQLFGDNINIEGVDIVNVCYGGINVVFNFVNWIEFFVWDGCDVIVVVGDIVFYVKGNVCLIGGVGVVVFLIGFDVFIVFEFGMCGSYMQYVYDFYKFDFIFEYFYVDGYYFINCYFEVFDGVYCVYCKCEVQFIKGVNGYVNGNVNGVIDDIFKIFFDCFDYMVFYVFICKFV